MAMAQGGKLLSVVAGVTGDKPWKETLRYFKKHTLVYSKANLLLKLAGILIAETT